MTSSRFRPLGDVREN